MLLAPIVIFVYNRPSYTKQTLEALSNNEFADQSDLFIYADGAKKNASEKEKQKIIEVRKLIREKKWCKTVTIFESENNLGLANSVIKGVTEIVNKYNKVIVIEDDVISSTYFLRFMNEALNKYAQVDKVLSIGSWNYYFPCTYANTFFTHLPDTIAWATWKRAWMKFDTDANSILNQLNQKKLIHKFNIDGKFNFEAMLKLQIENKISSWAIRWTATAVLNNTLTLYPSHSLTKHIGFGKDSTHVKSADYNADLQLATSPIILKDIPLIENTEAVNAYVHFEKCIIPERISIRKRLLSRLKYQIKKYLHPFKKAKYGWFGNYASWNEAKQQCTGYDAANILEKIKISILKVKNGEAVYERDSVLFDEIQYSFPLLYALQYIAAENNNKLSVIDFGGSLGSSYFQNKKILDGFNKVHWSIVEQPNFVDVGKEAIQDNRLKFYTTIDAAIEANGKPDLVILSCSIQYIENPYKLLSEVVNKKSKYIIIENTPFNYKKGDRITKQVVWPHIYTASYPCWFLDYERIKQTFREKYTIMSEYQNELYIYLDGRKISYQGIILKRN